MREPVAMLAKVDLTFAGELVPGPRRIHLAIVPPEGDHPVDNTPKYLAIEYTQDTLQAQVDFVVDTVVQLFRCIRQHWSWEHFHTQFEMRQHANRPSP